MQNEKEKIIKHLQKQFSNDKLFNEELYKYVYAIYFIERQDLNKEDSFDLLKKIIREEI